MIVLLVASASLAAAVTPTAAPTAAFSSTALAARSASLTGPTSNSSMSFTLTVNVRVEKLASALVARTVML